MKTASPKTLKLSFFFGIFFIVGFAVITTQSPISESFGFNSFAQTKPQSQETSQIKNLLLEPEKSAVFSNQPLSDLFEPANETEAKKTSGFPVRRLSNDSKTKIKDEKPFDQLIVEAQNKGKVRVIVGLNVNFVAEGNLAENNLIEEQRAEIRAAQDNLLGQIKQFGVEKIKKFDFIPFMALETDANAVAFMKYSPEVNFIQEDTVGEPMLAESTKVVRAHASWTAGLTGSGWTIAILDSGVDKNHPFLSGKVVSEACYSSTVNATDGSYTSVCPGGVASSTASGSGVNCSSSINGCDHGTHVAGIAAGNNSSSEADGVAKDSSIIAVQIFSRRNSDNEARFFTSDMIKGLERVYALRNTYSIAAVNMSVGGGGSTTTCDSSQAASKTAIDNLRSAGIATIISSGNDGFINGLSAPACISTAISVGSVRDGGSNVTTGSVDTPSSFSNSASFLSLLAPGELINSSVPGSGYADKQGTSMAAPHVAGAWAILKQRMGSGATVQQILDRLNNTGVSVTDSRNNITKKSIRIDTAIYADCNPSLSSTSASFNGSGGNGSFNLTITGCGWNAISNASWITTSSFSNGGSGTITYAVAANNSTNARTGTISVAGQVFTVTQSGVSCTPSLSSYSANVGSGGGTGSFVVNSPAACGGWNASSNQSWASISSNGIDTLTYTVAANTTANARTAIITVMAPGGNLTFTITQDGVSCNTSLSSNSTSVIDTGGTGSFNITRPAGCAGWTAISTVTWITVTSGGSGTGNGTVNYSVAANTSASSRTGTISVSGGATFTISQAGAPACSYSLAGYGKTFNSNAGTSTMTVLTNRSHCSWSAAVASGASWLTITGNNDGAGFGSVSFSVTANTNAASRAGTISVAGQTFTVRQAGANLPCTRYLDGLIHWYRGENDASDSIGANNGTTEGIVTYVAGKSGQAMSFDGNDSVAVQRQIADSFSIEFWLRTTSTGSGSESHWYQGAGLIDAEMPGVTNDFGVSLGNGKVLFGTGNPDTTIRSTTTVNNGQWHHVVATREISGGNSTSTLRLFVDGQAVSVGAGGTQSLASPAQVTLGKLQTGVSYFNGQIDEVKIYDYALTSTEVNNLYAGCSVSLPSLSVNDLSVNEGNTGASNADFTVSLSAASNQTVTIAYTTQAVTATAGSDFAATSGTLTIPVGQTSGTIGVPIIGDTVDEPDETFKILLSSPTNATIADNEATGTILDDEASCSYSISPTFYIFSPSAGSINITVMAPAGCSWTAATALDWVSITSGASGSGNGTVTIAVPANTSVNFRSGVINIGGIEFSVGQQAAPSYSIAGIVSYGATPANQTTKFVPGVQMLVTGTSSTAAASNSSGTYSLTGLAGGGNYTVTPAKTTDKNGITAFDATLILRCVAAGGNCSLTVNQRTAADSDNNGLVSSFDAAQILRYVAGNGANANTGQTGNWKFTEPSTNYYALSASLSGQNYTAFLIGEVDGNWTPPATLTETEASGYSESLLPFYDLMTDNPSRLKLFEISNRTKINWK